MNKVLVVSVHPDDETLGCGGTLLKHKQNGDEIHWLICTETDISDGFYHKRLKEIEKVSNGYDFDSVCSLKLLSTKVDEYSMSSLIGKISKVVNRIKPTLIYLPFKNDVHSDHRKIFEASYSCTKTFRYPFIKKIYMMEVLSETEFCAGTQSEGFVPNVFVDITDFFDKKLKLMSIFESELGEHPFPRSLVNIKSLAMLRGATAGCCYAESFVLLKEIR